jgi:hypothetical protein
LVQLLRRRVDVLLQEWTSGMEKQQAQPVEIQILAYAPTEFFHCQHCEVVWQQVGIGDRFRAERREAGLLPADLAAVYSDIADWAFDALARYGGRLSIKPVDAVSLEGVWKSLRYRVRRFPAFLFADGDRVIGFDRARLDAALSARLAPLPGSGREQRPDGVTSS